MLCTLRITLHEALLFWLFEAKSVCEASILTSSVLPDSQDSVIYKEFHVIPKN